LSSATPQLTNALSSKFQAQNWGEKVESEEDGEDGEPTHKKIKIANPAIPQSNNL
jgi:hypothetical protein